MHIEAVIELVGRCTWRAASSQLRDVLRVCDGANVEIYLEAMIKQDWRNTRRWSIWRQWMGGVLGAEILFIG